MKVDGLTEDSMAGSHVSDRYEPRVIRFGGW
jgi:hypothetical protein